MVEVVISRKLPIDEQSPEWRRLARLARVRVAPLARTNLKNAVGVLSVLSDTIDAAFFKRAPHLKVVANYAVGYNNIDVAAATRHGALVCNTPDVLTNATAELAIGLMFAAARRFKEGTELIRTRRFKGWDPYLLLGRELGGAKLGVIGYGRIGEAVAHKARALGMRVVKHGSRNTANNLERLLASSDFISLHCPLNSQTKGLLGPRQFAVMKHGAFLINAARGELVDESALVRALRTKRLAGAALDVFGGEPHLRAALLRQPNVFVLPHLGSATREARVAMAKLAVGAIAAVLSGRTPKNRVN